MPRNGTKNLIPLNQRTKEEQREIQSKAGKASGESRRKRKTLREELIALLSDGNTQEKISVAMIDQALCGNVKAFETIRDTIGEKPVDKVMVADIDAAVINDVEKMVLGKIEPSSKKKIICIDKKTGEILGSYDSVKSASQDKDVFSGSINKCLKGSLKSAGGFIWKYEEE